MAGASALAGRHIVITRPTGQDVHFAQTLLALGAHPIRFPVLEILPLTDDAPLRQAAARLGSYQWAIFISINAITHAMPVLLAHRAWPHTLAVATIGEQSAQALQHFGIDQVLRPTQRFDSEALLELAPMQAVAGQRILIFRGEAGRELLATTLRARSAQVDYCPCYQRRVPDRPPTLLWQHWQDGTIDAVTVTSSEAMRNLHCMIGKLGQAWLHKTPLFVPHARIQEAALALGYPHTMLTGPGDSGLIEGLCAYFADKPAA